MTPTLVQDANKDIKDIMCTIICDICHVSVGGTQLISRTKKKKHNLEEIKDLINKELSTTQEQDDFIV